MDKGAGNNAQLISFIDRLRRCDNGRQAWLTLDQELKDNGISHALYGFAARNAKEVEPELLFHSHSDEFFEGYGTQGVELDWATVYCTQYTDPVLWNTEELRASLSEEQIKIEDRAFDFNIAEGLTIPLRGGSSYGWGGVGLSATGMKKEEWYRLLIDRKDYLNAIVQAFHEFMLLRGFFEPYPLTEREKEVMKLIVDGLSRKEIVRKLNIDTKTVEAHTYSIRRKLHCTNDVQVAVKAITFNLID